MESLEQLSKLGGTPEGAKQQKITVDVLSPGHSMAFRLPLHIVIDPPALVSEILKASRRNKLRLKGFHVVAGFFTQPQLGC